MKITVDITTRGDALEYEIRTVRLEDDPELDPVYVASVLYSIARIERQKAQTRGDLDLATENAVASASRQQGGS